MRQALSSTQRGYDLLAPKFDLTPFRTPQPILEAVGPELGDGGRLLDVCCGTGAAMEQFRARCREVVGLDFSRGMLAEAARRAAEWKGEAPVRFVRGDARTMPFDGVFDAAVCFGALGHFDREDHDRFLAAVARALRPGGRFLFVTGRRPSFASPAYWMAKGFNAAMRVRNAVRSPPFVMYYLQFLLPEVLATLERHGFSTEVRPLVFTGRFEHLRNYVVVIATRRS